MNDMQQSAEVCLKEVAPSAKISLTNKLFHDWRSGLLIIDTKHQSDKIIVPGRPDKPELVSPKHLSKRSANNPQGKAALIHALCHIEFNAINLALDAVYRFNAMPNEFYGDWIRVAKEEAYHYGLLADHLQTLGYQYGDFVAHNGLWEMAVETDHDVLVRMALVPRVMEARGLDVTPSIMEKLGKAGDNRAVEILKIIQRDEVGHVEIGTRWFRFLCEQRELEPLSTFKQLLQEHMKGRIRGPFDYIMRKQAGFTAEEMAFLEEAG